MNEKLSPERVVRLLRAKAGELEAQVKADIGVGGMAAPHRNVEQQRINYLAADIALVAGLLADHIERVELRHVLIGRDPGPWDRPDTPGPGQPGDASDAT